MIDQFAEPHDSLTGFIGAVTSGAVIHIAPGPLAETQDDLNKAQELLREVDLIARLHAPLDAPAFDVDSAVWAARVMRFCCRMLVDRIETETELPEQLCLQQPSGDLAQQHWSTDLIFRTWWDLMKRAKSLSANDPLSQTLEEIAERWPLAAVGTHTKCQPAHMDVVWNDACLRRLLADRVLRRQDRELSQDPRIAEAIQRIKMATEASLPLTSNG